ncbi:hypothetical protein [Azospirillum sp. TSH58]|uniref:hypothetical protein n=1 Tax=Azospirillum sp. TSH58 TaxID=664962 RepID=UPI0011B22DC9|nr:hypothetical protein [Azospirillum sp. TSH58]
MMRVALFELDCHHRASGHVHRWFLSTGRYVTWATDTPRDLAFLPLVEAPPRVTVSVSSWGRTRGGSRVEVAPIRLLNPQRDRAVPAEATVYDVTAGAWLRLPLAERPLNILLTDYEPLTIIMRLVESDRPYAAAVLHWRGRCRRWQPERAALRLPVADRMGDFDQPVLTDRYDETAPESLRGLTKELVIGHAPIMEPTYLGIVPSGTYAGLHRWSTCGGLPIEGVPRFWDRGVDYNPVTALPVAASKYFVSTSDGMVYTSVKPTTPRCEVKGWKPGGVWLRHIGQVIGHLGTSAGLIGAADPSGMDATPRTVNVVLPPGDTTTHAQLYDRLAGSVARGYWLVDLLGETLIVGRLPRADDGEAVRTYRAATGSTSGLEPEDLGSDELPARQVVLRWGRNMRPDSTTASDAEAGTVALWTRDWREAPSTVDAQVVAIYGQQGSRIVTLDSELAYAADAAAEVPLWADELAVPSRGYVLPVHDGAPGVTLCDRVLVIDTVAEFGDGARAVVYGRDIGEGAAGTLKLFVVR